MEKEKDVIARGFSRTRVWSSEVQGRFSLGTIDRSGTKKQLKSHSGIRAGMGRIESGISYGERPDHWHRGTILRSTSGALGRLLQPLTRGDISIARVLHHVGG